MNPPVVIDPRYHDAVIFDLCGVLTDAALVQSDVVPGTVIVVDAVDLVIDEIGSCAVDR